MRVGAGFIALLAGAALLLAGSILAAVALGSVPIPPADVLAIVLGKTDAASVHRQIVLELRLPRAILGAVVGGTLAAVGTTLQAVMRSALADPYILGVSSGAAVGASLAVVFGGLTSARGFGVTLAAFATGLASVAAVYVAANVRGRVPAVRLLLAGVAWSSFSSAITGFILFLAPEAAQVRGVVFWLMGGLAGADWAGAGWTAAIALPCIVVLAATGRWQNLLLLGDEAALSLGLDVSSARGRLVVLASLATGAAVAFSGAIGFVGLVIPHVLRPLVGPDHRRLIPASVLAGALLLVWMDVLARTLLTPRELPVGLLTGLLGAPFFLLLLRRHHGEAD